MSEPLASGFLMVVRNIIGTAFDKLKALAATMEPKAGFRAKAL